MTSEEGMVCVPSPFKIILPQTAKTWYLLTTEIPGVPPMPEDDATTTVNVGNIHVDRATVTNPGPDRKQMLLQMTPLISLLITVVALVISSLWQVWQNRTTTAQKIDEDWRDSLEKISDDKDALISTLEMETFLKEPQYRARAEFVIGTKLPKIADKDEYDAVFQDMRNRTILLNEMTLLTVSRAITSDLGSQYALLPKDKRDSHTFAAFLLDPESAGMEGTQLNEVLTNTWKLDSTIRKLQAVWKTSGVSQNSDVSGIEFYGGSQPAIDFTGISFPSNADFGGSEFLGECIVTDPAVKSLNHCAAATQLVPPPVPPAPTSSARTPAASTPAPAAK
jgi:hypothetical protein